MIALICPNEFGVYDGKIYLQFPSHMLSENGGFYTSKQGCLIDICIANEIKELWDKGVSTYGSCCGHGVAHGMINVDKKDVEKMVSMGYDYHPDIKEDFHPHTFIPKSEHKNTHTLK